MSERKSLEFQPKNSRFEPSGVKSLKRIAPEAEAFAALTEEASRGD